MLDLHEAHAWYEEQQIGLGDELAADIAEAFERIQRSPEAFPIYYRGLRRMLTLRFPYKVFYAVEGELVIIMRMLHAARDHRSVFDL